MSRSPAPDFASNVEGIRATVLAAFVALKGEEAPRDYLGASSWGKACKRELAYGWHKFPPEPSTFPREQMHFITEMGHAGEPIVTKALRAAGFELLTENQRTGKQWGFYAADGKLRGHCDGIIMGGPSKLDDGTALQFPLIWENKMLNDKGWKLVRKHGYKEAKPIYYSQINTYGAYFDIPNGGIVTAVNRDSGQLYMEHIPFDAAEAQRSSDKAVDVIESESPEEFGRLSDDPDYFGCRLCDFRKRCHGIENPQLMQLPKTK